MRDRLAGLRAQGSGFRARAPSPQPRARSILSVCLCGILWFCGVAVYADGLRDPFVFGPRESAPEQPGAVLMGVLWDATHPLAIVGEQTVGVGDRVADWQVVEIHENGIVVQRDDRREIVSIGNRIPTD